MSSVLDTQLFRLLYGWLQPPPWGGLMSAVTHLGDPVVVIVLTIGGASESAVAWIRRKSPPLLAWIGVGIAPLIAKGLKDWVSRPRPFEMLPSMGIPPGLPGESFPSGHTTGAFAVAAVLSRRFPRLQWLFWSLAALVGLSRVALGRHWPSDVVAGALIGIGSVAIFSWIERKRYASSRGVKN